MKKPHPEVREKVLVHGMSFPFDEELVMLILGSGTKQLPVDVLKLDKGFMDNFRNEEPDGRDKAIISHVILMAKDLNMEVLAEGVETENQQKFLKNAECDMIQGYYYSKPISISEFDQIFRDKRSVKPA